MAHKISRSEVDAVAQLLPGYGAIRLNPPRPRRVRLKHMAMVLVAVSFGLIAAGAEGLLP